MPDFAVDRHAHKELTRGAPLGAPTICSAGPGPSWAYSPISGHVTDGDMAAVTPVTLNDSNGSLIVSINGNTRYVTYTVTGEPGKYAVNMQPTANGGRAPPT